MILLEDFNYIERYDTIIEEAKDGPKKYVLRGIFSRVNTVNKNKRIYPKSVMEQCLIDLRPTIEAKGLAGELDHPMCIGTSEFSILAKEGWKEFIDVKVGDEVATLDENNNIVYQKVQTVINEPHKGKIYHLKGRNIDVLFTGTHRLYLENRYGKREIVTVKEIFENRKKYNKHKIIKLGNWVNDTNEYININGLQLPTKEFMAFMGIYLSEGFVIKDRDSVSISQNEGRVADRIRELLGKLSFKVNEHKKKRENSVFVIWNVSSKELSEYLRPCLLYTSPSPRD